MVEESRSEQGRRRPAQGDGRADARKAAVTGCRIARSHRVGEEAGSRAGVGVEAREDRRWRRATQTDLRSENQKVNADQDDRRERKPRSSDREKDSLGQPINWTGGRTLGTGGAAPGDRKSTRLNSSH